ncbi:ATP-binding protein [Planctobacterium marinum]|uniref:histidine kinase n=1 Tax=Planctobacterium marinum TaxID=1631968 RepID=A0AA48HS84_9ALTE|nr:two-component sensor histidine kinase [Planctobacterium marinum]
MQKLFLGIYGSILASTFLVLLCSYYVLSSINQYRYEQHLEMVLEGTASLLHKGISRQEEANQVRWISLASSLLDANLTITESTFSQQHKYSLKRVNNSSAQTSEKYIAHYQAPQSSLRVSIEFDGITEHILSATAFFMLNELGRLPAEQRQAAFDEMRQHFHYSVFRVPQIDLNLDSRQQSRLKNGDTVVAVIRELGRGSAFNVYAPWGKTSDALVLGPIAFFNPYPNYIAALVLGVALLIMAVVVMLIIRKLGQRLTALQASVDAISPAATEIPEQDENQEVISALSSKIQNMAQRIEKLLEEKAYMIRAVSHDLRTPIAKLHFRLEAISEKVGSDDKMVRSCHDDLRQLNLLIDELLTYEKLEATRDIKFKPLDLAHIISNQVDGLKVVNPKLNIKTIPPDLPATGIAGNEVLLCRLFENILHNAERYAKNQIAVEIIQHDDDIEVVVDDDGEGLQENVIPYLFDPFFRADQSRNSAKGGYGLGLAIARQIVLQHHGSIKASNNELGGARFQLRLPLEQANHD